MDWELSTIGDYMSDIANLCLMYYMPRIECGFGVAGIAGKDIQQIKKRKTNVSNFIFKTNHG